MVLDRGIPRQPLDDLEFHSLLQDVVTGLDMSFRRANQHSRSRMAALFSRYVAEFETQIGIRCEKTYDQCMEDWTPKVNLERIWRRIAAWNTNFDGPTANRAVGWSERKMAKLKLWHFRRNANQKPQRSSIAFHPFAHGNVMWTYPQYLRPCGSKRLPVLLRRDKMRMPAAR